MKVKIGTRVLDESYFIETFMEHYLDMGVDEIHVFDSGSQDGTVEVVRGYEARGEPVRLVSVGPDLRHISRAREALLCNHIIKYAVKDYERREEPCWWIFPDLDEFVRPPEPALCEFLETCDVEVLRGVLIDWYLPPSLAAEDLPSRQVLRLVQNGQLKGRVSDLWGDPFYKDYVVRLDERTMPRFRGLQTVSGFHRLVLDGEIFLPSNDCHIVVDHLRGIPRHKALQRIDSRLRALDGEWDDWSLEHFLLIRSQFEDYTGFLAKASLQSPEELESTLGSVSRYDNGQSFFNRVIMRENIHEPDGSRPSMHGLVRSGDPN